MNTGKMSPSTPRRRAQGSLPAAHVAEMQLFPHLRILGLPLTPRVLPLLMCPQDISAHLKNDFFRLFFSEGQVSLEQNCSPVTQPCQMPPLDQHGWSMLRKEPPTQDSPGLIS